MFLIDQHAAHERFLFDRLSAREISMASQALLVPYEIRLTPSEADALQSFRQDLEELGYAFDHVGSLTVSVKSVPVLNGVQLRESYLHEALEIFIEYGSTALKHMVSEKLMQSACKHAVKAGEPLQKEEIEELLSLFVRGEIPLTCPHGRPVIIRIRKTELDKMFRRIV